MINAIAIDDEPLALEIIETFSKKFDFLNLQKVFTKASIALQYLEKNAIDLLFLDINMPSISGIDFYQSLKHKPMVIFTTSYSSYALESYDLNTLDYLLKPFTLDRFEKAVIKAYEMHKLLHNTSAIEDQRFIMLKSDYGIAKVSLIDILFIEGLDNYIKIHLQNSSPIVVRLTMKALMEKLPSKNFIRVHRSYIIAVNKFESFKHNMISIAGEEIPVGKSYEAVLRSTLGISS